MDVRPVQQDLSDPVDGFSQFLGPAKFVKKTEGVAADYGIDPVLEVGEVSLFLAISVIVYGRLKVNCYLPA